MNQYLELLKDVSENGYDTQDRTGTGTRSVFGRQMRFNLQDGFPLVTTKKVYTRAIIHELLWFIKGDTNIKYLTDNNVNIWSDWADDNGDLGRIYGSQWTAWEVSDPLWHTIPVRLPVDSVLEQNKNPIIAGVGYLGNLNKFNKCSLKFKKSRNLWRGMLQRCYDPSQSRFSYYGGRGTTVCTRWHSFENFLNDITSMKGYNGFIDSNYELDKDYYGANQYGPTTSMFISHELNIKMQKQCIPVTYQGKIYPTLTALADVLGVTRNTIKNTLEGKSTPKKAELLEVKRFEPHEGYLLRPMVYINQLDRAIETIRTNPTSRRILVSAWNPSDMNQSISIRAKLDSCHCFMQFKVYGDTLHLQLYQRSGDLFLGIPFNIASYAILLSMVAQVTNLKAGEFIHTIGDAHIYNNHKEQVAEQLKREPMPLPKLWLNPNIKNIDDFKFEDIKILDYKSHPTIKGDVAV